MDKSLKTVLSRYRPELEGWGIKGVAVLTGLMSAINLVSSVTPVVKSRLLLIEDALPMEVRQGSRLGSALAGFALFLLAGSLWRRKRIAWILTVALLVLSSILHMLKGLDYEEASFALVLLIPLVLLRRGYQAVSDPPSIRQGLVVLGAAFGFTLVYGTLGFYGIDRHFGRPFNFFSNLQLIFSLFTSISYPGQLLLTGFSRYLAESIYIIGIATLGYALLMLIRPVLSKQPATNHERDQVRALVAEYGQAFTCGLALLKDKSYFFSRAGAVVPYAVRGRGAMALGDPIGLVEDTQEAIEGFRSHCQKNDWCPAFVAVLPDHLDIYRKASFDLLPIGCEAVVDVNEFTLSGNENKDLRVPYHKLNRLGYQSVLFSPPITNHVLEQLRVVSEDWLASQKGGENRFSVGWFDDDYVRTSPIMAVLNPEGSIIAFVNLLMVGDKEKLTIDLMRRQPQAPNGTMEFLFVSLLRWAQAQDFTAFSLGTCITAEISDLDADDRLTKTIFKIAETLNRFYHFQGLYEFKRKFHPIWQPRYLAYPGITNLPLVLSTLIRVHKDEN